MQVYQNSTEEDAGRLHWLYYETETYLYLFEQLASSILTCCHQKWLVTVISPSICQINYLELKLEQQD